MFSLLWPNKLHLRIHFFASHTQRTPKDVANCSPLSLLLYSISQLLKLSKPKTSYYQALSLFGISSSLTCNVCSLNWVGKNFSNWSVCQTFWKNFYWDIDLNKRKFFRRNLNGKMFEHIHMLTCTVELKYRLTGESRKGMPTLLFH